MNTAEANRKKQHAQREERRTKEAQFRPDVLHRAVHFLLTQQAVNMPDTTEEAQHHMGALDAELATRDEPADPGPGDDAAGPADPPAPAARQSRRFER